MILTVPVSSFRIADIRFVVILFSIGFPLYVTPQTVHYDPGDTSDGRCVSSS